jgi:transposase
VNKDKFCDYLKDLRERIGKRSAAIALDNLRVHHSKQVVEVARQLDFDLIFTPPYSPNLNSIEFVFSKVKNIFRRLKTENVVNGRKVQTSKLIDQSFAAITKDDCHNVIRHVFDLLELAATQTVA